MATVVAHGYSGFTTLTFDWFT